MKTLLYVFSGTGNSLYVARKTAELLGSTDIRPMNDKNSDTSNYDTVGIIFPVYIWGVPRIVLNFVNYLKQDKGKYYFAIAVNGGQVAGTLLQLQNVLKKRGLFLSSGFSIIMPSNYIPWSGPGSRDLITKRYSKADDKIQIIAKTVRENKISKIEKGPIWQNIIFSLIYRLSFNRVSTMDKSFFTDENCNGCGICEKICPVKNIVMKDFRPVWKNNCEQCMACIQWCPQKSIQCSKKTSGYERYHHDAITINDIIRNNQI